MKIRLQESIATAVVRKIQELVTECVKDLSGGVLPTGKQLRRLLRREIHPDGHVFHFRGQPMLFIAPHRFTKVDGEWQLQIPHTKLYEKEPQQPVAASN